MAYPLTVRKVPKAEIAQRVAKALAMVQLERPRPAYPSQLSGGQQQRVALARALVFEPQLVLMDEPLGALDKQLREHMQIELKELHRQLGVTFVYVTHDQGEALTMSDRVAVFNDGAIQQIDAVDEPLRDAGEPLRRRLHRRQHAAHRHGRQRRRRSAASCVLPTGERLAGVNVNGGGRAPRWWRRSGPSASRRTCRRPSDRGQPAAGRGRRRDLLRRPPAPALRRAGPGRGHRQAAARPACAPAAAGQTRMAAISRARTLRIYA